MQALGEKFSDQEIISYISCLWDITTYSKNMYESEFFDQLEQFIYSFYVSSFLRNNLIACKFNDFSLKKVYNTKLFTSVNQLFN